MAYHVYDTEAFVLDEHLFGEANKVYHLLTPDLGFVLAAAQGVRLLKSKLRFQVTKLSRVRVSLVRGKEVWRLIGAEKDVSFEEMLSSNDKRELVAKIFSLLAKYIRGEGEQIPLFGDLTKAFDLLKQIDLGDKESLLGWELAVALRSLHDLGYVENDPKLLPIISKKEWDSEMLLLAASAESEIVTAVNKAQAASHI